VHEPDDCRIPSGPSVDFGAVKAQRSLQSGPTGLPRIIKVERIPDASTSTVTARCVYG